MAAIHQSSCFICTKGTYQNEKKGKSSVREHSIRTVFRHLKIYQVIKVNNNDKLLVDLVPFCKRCYKLFKRLSSYCANLELLQMRISYFLNKLNELVVEKDSKQSITTIDESRKLLKNRLGEKCMLHKQTIPFLILPNVDVEQVSTKANPITKTSSGNLTCDDNEQDDEMSTHELNTNPPSKNKSRKPQQSSLNKRDVLDSASKKTVPCLDCDCYFETKSHILQHSLRFHPEKHFPSNSKPDSLTLLQHRMYLTHLLKTEVDSSGSWICGYQCANCSFKTKTGHSLRHHLTKEHQDKLLDKLVHLKMEISPEDISTKVKMPPPPIKKSHGQAKEENLKLKQFCKTKNKLKSEYTCSICEVRTTSPRKHKALHHPESFMLSKRLKQVTPEQFKMYCVYLINKQVENFTKSQQNDKKVRFHCTHCQNSYIDLQGCRNHLVLAHDDLLSVEVEKLQQTMTLAELNTVKTVKTKAKYYLNSTKKIVEVSTMKCEICNVLLTQRGLTLHMRKKHPNEYLKIDNCEMCLICKQKFRYKWWLNFRKTRSHPEVLFEKWRNVEMTTVVQFKRYCKYVIDTEVCNLGQVGTTDEKLRYKCQYCSNTFCDTKYAQIHLVMGHEEILGRKLEELQKSKKVEELFAQGMVNTNEESEEIFGEENDDNDFEATEVFCGKSVTKLEACEIWEENDDEMVDLEDLNENVLQQDNIEVKQEEDCKMDVEAIFTD